MVIGGFHVPLRSTLGRASSCMASRRTVTWPFSSFGFCTIVMLFADVLSALHRARCFKSESWLMSCRAVRRFMMILPHCIAHLRKHFNFMPGLLVTGRSSAK
jgi:hypothetical protein